MIRLNRTPQSALRLFAVTALAATAGCSVRVVSDDPDDASTTTTTTVAEEDAATTQPSEKNEVTETTQPDGGSGDESTATTDGSSSAGGSLADPISCDEFEALTPGGRMLSVYNGSAPDSGCDDLVAPAKVASDVFSVTADLAQNYGAVINGDRPSPLVSSATCADNTLTLKLENDFTSPLVLWGALKFYDEAGDTVAFKPFITDVLQPGAQATVTANANQYDPDSCAYDLRPLVAPTGELAPDVGGPQADGPQSGDQPEEWYPSLMQSEEDAVGSDDPADFVDFVEDIHSPDLWVQLFLDQAIEQVPVPEPVPSTVPSDGGQQVVLRSTGDSLQSLYCTTIDKPVIEGVEGELAMVLYEWARPSSSTPESFGLGLYRRGSDTRWRYIGRTAQLTDDFVNSTPGRCDPPPILD